MAIPTPTLEQLQAQLQQIQQRGPVAVRGMANGGMGMGAANTDSGVARFVADQQRLSQQIQQLQNSNGVTNDPIAKARDEAYGLVRGAVSRVNPIDQQILAALQERSGADAGPFDAATRNALMTQASDAAGQAALQQRGRIQGSASDPSVMAANNEADARRQQAIQQAQLGITSQANVANYDARGQALGQLGGYNQQVQGNQTSNERYLMDMLRQESRYQPDAQQGGVPSFTQFRIGGSTAPAAPAAAQAPAPPTAAQWLDYHRLQQGNQRTAQPAQPAQGQNAQNLIAPRLREPAQTTLTRDSYTGGIPGNNAYQFFPQTKTVSPTSIR